MVNKKYPQEFRDAKVQLALNSEKSILQIGVDLGANSNNLRHTFITAMLNSEKFKIMEIAAIVGHTSPQMIMTNYAGFIKKNHLKVDTSIDLFANHGDTLGDTNQINRLKRA